MKKIWKIRRDEEAVSPVIATILMVAITVVLAAVLYIMVTGMTSGPTTLDSVGGTLETVTGGWKFTCASGTKGFPMASTNAVILSEQGQVLTSQTLTDIQDETTPVGNFTWWDNDGDNKLTAGDTIFIQGGTTNAIVQSDDTFQITTTDTILYDRTMP